MNTFLLFEVMDKELSLSFIWIYFGSIAIGGFFLVRKHPAFLLLVVPLWLLAAPLHFWELNDEYVGPHILQEAGYTYIIQSYIAMIIGAVLPLIGLILWIRGKVRTKPK